ncbi:ferritin-like domain-containing protein [Geminocystis sp. CENA526]|uniref:ferritin-like domain-containing protein n=1 Tax=Geminocystis sp. CENA526 TaxID=1355871 RepID=UPI003D6FAB3A
MLKNLEIALNEAIQDEYKACETYQVVMEKFGYVRPFSNIIESEKRHIQALIRLFRKYQIPIPINTWGGKISAPKSLQEACEEGVKAEIENGEMYDRLLNLTREYSDVQRVFLNLQRASQQSHLPAFMRGAQKNAHYSEEISSNFGRGNQRGCRHRNRGKCRHFS